MSERRVCRLLAASGDAALRQRKGRSGRVKKSDPLGSPILAAALNGELPPRITLDDLIRAARQLDWQHQADQVGLQFLTSA
ncbi:MAG: hypothetical protein AAGI54_06810 [Planctomycetota bacterium]